MRKNTPTFFAKANEVAAANNKRLSDRLRDAEVELEVKRLAPRLEVIVKENDKLK